MSYPNKPWMVSEVIARLQELVAEHGDMICDTPPDDRGGGDFPGITRMICDVSDVAVALLDLDWVRP